LYALPPHESLDCLILGQAELVVELGGGAVALFGPLPELALIGAGEHRLILLALMAENGVALAHQLLWAEGDGHLDLLRLPFLPGAAVEPHLTFPDPRLIFQSLECAEHGLQADAMGAMRVGQIARGVNLVRADLLKQIDGDLDVLLTE